MSFPIALGIDVVKALEQCGTFAEQRVDLGFGPNVKLPFLVLAVGVEAAGEPALLAEHLAADPIEGLLDALRIEGAMSLLPDQGQKIDELGVVIEHLLEMRHQPALVGRIAREAPAEMIVDAALAHRVERLGDRVAVRRLAAALPSMPQQLEDPGLRKFRRGADPAMKLVDLAQQPLGDPVELLRRYRAAALRAGEPLQRLAQSHDILGDLLTIADIGGADRFEDLREPRAPPARLRREVGPAPEGLAIGRQEHGQWPAAMLPHQGQRMLVDLIESGPFLAIACEI